MCGPQEWEVGNDVPSRFSVLCFSDFPSSTPPCTTLIAIPLSPQRTQQWLRQWQQWKPTCYQTHNQIQNTNNLNNTTHTATEATILKGTTGTWATTRARVMPLMQWIYNAYEIKFTVH